MKEEETYCHYSDLPSPLAYIKDDYIDSDGMGNQEMSPNKKDEIKSGVMKRLISKILLWWSYKKPKNNKKSIWDL